MNCLILCLLVACNSDTHTDDQGLWAVDYVGEPGTYLQLGPTGDPLLEPNLIIRMEETTWTLRQGMGWASAEELAEFDIDTSQGLKVGDDVLLPERLVEGQSSDGVEITAIGDAEVYYGIFPDTVTVDVQSGRWAGEQIFAAGVGLIYVTFDGESWEMVYYL